MNQHAAPDIMFLMSQGNTASRYPPEPLTPSEVAALLNACSQNSSTGIRNHALITLLYRSGLRISEALNLRSSDISLERHFTRVLHGKGDIAIVRGFHPTATASLEKWIDTRRRLEITGTSLFCTLRGGKLSDRYVRDMLKRLGAQVGIEKRIHPHGFRHTFADELRVSGMDVVQISKLLGHSSIAVTHRYLDHLTNSQAIEALEQIRLPPLPPLPDRRTQMQEIIVQADGMFSRNEIFDGVDPAIIYSLLDLDDTPRYVGSTTREVSARIKDHMRHAQSEYIDSGNLALGEWLRSLPASPKYMILARVKSFDKHESSRWQSEAEWIRFHRQVYGDKILNRSPRETTQEFQESQESQQWWNDLLKD